MSEQHRPPAYCTERGLAETISVALEGTPFPQYAFGIIQAAALGRCLGLNQITALELGVAGGNGLVELERLSRRHSGPSEVEIRIVGFDLGTGMPSPVDHRDMPYIWQRGFFRMEEAKLRSRLSDADLILGDVTDTGRRFLASSPAPIGFISFDLDYYSATVSAFEALLTADADRYLPRVICYFDDTVGPLFEMHSSFTGELLAIEDFNRTSRHRKLGKLNGLRYKLRPHEGPWVEGIFVLHVFDHSRYNDYIYPQPDRQFPLDE
jgi:hypothetical protein